MERLNQPPFDDSLYRSGLLRTNMSAFQIRPKRSGKENEVSNEPPIFPKPDRQVYIRNRQGGSIMPFEVIRGEIYFAD
ncbi:MAG: hypothetical protein LBQ48_01475, partial [Oscillospiraceae bacterium]|nr:hypothetical protein [Oscillospiraceae bacterium]